MKPFLSTLYHSLSLLFLATVALDYCPSPYPDHIENCDIYYMGNDDDTCSASNATDVGYFKYVDLTKHDAMEQLTKIFTPPTRNETAMAVPFPRVLQTAVAAPRVDENNNNNNNNNKIDHQRHWNDCETD